MTLQELSCLYQLKAERKKLHRRRAEARAESTGIGTPRLDGMPKGMPGCGSKVERYAIQLADLDAAIDEKDAEIAREEILLWSFIASVPDSKIRLALMLRFADGMEWDQVACGMGGDATPWQIKKLCYRYLEKARPQEDITP